QTTVTSNLFRCNNQNNVRPGALKPRVASVKLRLARSHLRAQRAGCGDTSETPRGLRLPRRQFSGGVYMLRVVAAAAALAVGATVVLAQNAAVIDQRKQAMKAFGGAAKSGGAMAKGEAPFDLAKAQESLKTIQTKAGEVKNLFPDDSKTGDTAASPEAFANKADLMA